MTQNVQIYFILLLYLSFQKLDIDLLNITNL